MGTYTQKDKPPKMYGHIYMNAEYTCDGIFKANWKSDHRPVSAPSAARTSQAIRFNEPKVKTLQAWMPSRAAVGRLARHWASWTSHTPSAMCRKSVGEWPHGS